MGLAGARGLGQGVPGGHLGVEPLPIEGAGQAAQLDHVIQLLEQEGKVAQFKEACKKMVVASIGPTASERLRHYDLPVDIEPSHPKMGILVKEVSERARTLLDRKVNA